MTAKRCPQLVFISLINSVEVKVPSLWRWGGKIWIRSQSRTEVTAGFTSDAITGLSRSVLRGTLTVAQSLWTLGISDFAQIIIKFWHSLLFFSKSWSVFSSYFLHTNTHTHIENAHACTHTHIQTALAWKGKFCGNTINRQRITGS